MSKQQRILRTDVVDRLQAAALEGMTEQGMNTSPDEMYTAALVLAHRFVITAISRGSDLEPLKTLVAMIYNSFPQVTKH